MRLRARAAFLGGCALVLLLEAPAGVTLLSEGWHGPYVEPPDPRVAAQGVELPPLPALTLLAHSGPFTLVPR